MLTRAGRARPQIGGIELAIWYLMRVTGVALLILAFGHFAIMHVLNDVEVQDAQWIINFRWGSMFWRSYDWLMLSMVLFHSFMGMRTVARDYVKGGWRPLVMGGIYVGLVIVLVLGTIVVMTAPFFQGS
jgi:succinate dehydrogenase / fumarate reductase, membrane anchor subunit